MSFFSDCSSIIPSGGKKEDETGVQVGKVPAKENKRRVGDLRTNASSAKHKHPLFLELGMRLDVANPLSLCVGFYSASLKHLD